MRYRCDLLGAAVVFLFSGMTALAQTAAIYGSTPAAEDGDPTASQTADQAAPTGLWQRSQLLGDMGGLRPALAQYGIGLAISETSEVLGNLTGGVHRGFEYDGLTRMALTLDTEKAFGWQGGTFYASALQIHGRNLSADNLDVLQTISNIEADRATRLWELWFDQKLPGTPLDVRFGQQSADQEFIVDDYSAVFINAMMGWPALPSNDLYAGGPAYPLSSPAIRLRAKPTEAVTVLAGVFDDNPPGGPFFDDSQLRDGEASGTRFNLGTGALAIAEVQYHADKSPVLGLPGIYKLGAWVDTGPFLEERALGTPAGIAAPPFLHGNFSLYGIIDQTVWRPDAKSQRSLGLFFRGMGAPGDRNLVDFSLDTGIDVKAPLPGRPNDEFGIGYGRAHVGGPAFAAARDRAAIAGTLLPTGPNEGFIEITYDWRVTPWWQLQPDFQYVFNPLGDLATPSSAPQRIGDEAIFGLRTTILF
jgi:porin